MLQSLKAYRIFEGYRGEAPKDTDALAEFIVRIGDYAFENVNELKELDINPLFVYEKGVAIADALIVKEKL
jgi:hypothetical protein